MKCLLLMFYFVLCTCTFYEPEGKTGDIIKLSSKELLFNAEGGVDSVTTKMEGWQINYDIKIGDSTIYLCNSDTPSSCSSDIPYSLRERYDLNGEKYSEPGDVIYIEGPWFTVNRTEEKKLYFR